MKYMIVEEASGAIESFTDNLNEAIEDAKAKRGKYLVVENTLQAKVMFDSQPGITYKI